MKDWFWIPCAALGGLCAIGDLIFFQNWLDVGLDGMFGNVGCLFLFFFLHWWYGRD